LAVPSSPLSVTFVLSSRSPTPSHIPSFPTHALPIASGYLATLRESTDPQDASRVENLAELHAVAQEFADENPEADLGDFLERVALVADSDQIPDDDSGMVTLMTVHTAKGLEFSCVFVTGLEDGTFPHARSLGEQKELA